MYQEDEYYSISALFSIYIFTYILFFILISIISIFLLSILFLIHLQYLFNLLPKNICEHPLFHALYLIYTLYNQLLSTHAYENSKLKCHLFLLLYTPTSSINYSNISFPFSSLYTKYIFFVKHNALK